jgi:uncharacterized protein
MIDRKIIYSSPVGKFFDDVRMRIFADKMQDNFLVHYGRRVGTPEYNSWRDTGDIIKSLLELSDIENSYMAFEYQIPYNQKRIDCLLFGKDHDGKEYIIHIELKQWTDVRMSDCDGNFVETYTGGALRLVAHPSQQVEGYNNYLKYFVEVIYDGGTSLYGCSYCPNYNRKNGDGLFHNKYADIISEYPIYTHSEILDFAHKLNSLLKGGQGFSIFNKFMQSPIKPSQKLMENISNIILKKEDLSLLNEQLVAKNMILNRIKRAENNKEKSVVIVKGGPGTGKTVIALNVLAQLSVGNKRRTVFFASKSKPLLEAIKNRIGNKEAKLIIRTLTSFTPSKAEENGVDILLIDEAHRIQNKSNMQFTPKEDRTDMPQVEQLIRCAKTSVFFIDDIQIIRSLEIGSTNLIKEIAKKYECKIDEIELVSQFRCNGSDSYLDWIERMLGHRNETKTVFNPELENFDFRIFKDPTTLYEELLKKNHPPEITSRLVAGYCWPWSKKLDDNKQLVKDVKIGLFEMPWETHGKVNPPNGYPKWYEWAYKEGGIKQVGCIYTAQGFEFDYIGVIVGPDMKYDMLTDSLVGDVTQTKDAVLKRKKENFSQYVRNIYRVLMTRGMKGCYVYFVDKKTEEYFKKFIK